MGADLACSGNGTNTPPHHGAVTDAIYSQTFDVA
jgi:hypothetical protein